jgi:hypothetical protein
MMMLSMGEYDCSLVSEIDETNAKRTNDSNIYDTIASTIFRTPLVFSEGPVFWQRMVRTVNWKNHNNDQYERSRRKEQSERSNSEVPNDEYAQ